MTTIKMHLFKCLIDLYAVPITILILLSFQESKLLPYLLTIYFLFVHFSRVYREVEVLYYFDLLVMAS